MSGLILTHTSFARWALSILRRNEAPGKTAHGKLLRWAFRCRLVLSAQAIIGALVLTLVQPTLAQNSADLNSADLNSADLNSADLNSANQNSADLNSADLNSANQNAANRGGAAERISVGGDMLSDSGAAEQFSIGLEMLAAALPKYQSALLQFRHAYALSGNWKFLRHMGRCAQALQRDGEAIDYYTRYLTEGGESIRSAERETIERDVISLRASLATVSLSVDVPGASIIVKSKGRSAPHQLYRFQDNKATLGLRAGDYRIVITAAGKALELTVVLASQTTQGYRFMLGSGAAKAVAGSVRQDTGSAMQRPGSVDRNRVITHKRSGSYGGRADLLARPASALDRFSSGSGNWNTAGYFAAGVGAVSLGLGAVVAFKARRRQADLERVCTRNQICPNTASSALNDLRRTAVQANVLLVAGGIVAATGLTIVLIETTSGERPIASLNIAPQVSTQNVGLRLGGTF